MKASIFLTSDQTAIVQPLFDSLQKLNEASRIARQEMSGAAIAGQLRWHDGDPYPHVDFVLLSPEKAKRIAEAAGSRAKP